MTVTAEITLRDGRRAAVSGDTKADVVEQIRRLNASVAEPPGTGETLLRAAGRSFLDNMLQVPEQVIRPNAGSAPIIPTLPQLAMQTAFAPARGLRQDRQRQTGVVPPRQSVMGMPSGDELVASVAATLPGGGSYPGQLQRGQEIQKDRPILDTAGELIGDAATLAMGRAPLAGTINRAEKAFRNRAFKRLDADTEFSKAWNKLVSSDFMKDVIKRPAFRAAETGLEGATLALLKDGDPVDTALYSAATQLAGSGALGLVGHFLEGPPGKSGKIWRSFPLAARLTVGVASATTLWGVAQNLTPAGEENIFDPLEAEEAALDKATWAIGLGLMAGAAGLGRIRSADVPKLGDMVTALPRGAVVSLIEDLTAERNAGDDDVQNTMAHLINDSRVFSEGQIKQLNEAFDKGTFAGTVAQLQESDSQFAKLLLTAPEPPQIEAPVPRELDPLLRAENAAWHLMRVPVQVGDQQQQIPAGDVANSLRRRFTGLNRLEELFR